MRKHGEIHQNHRNRVTVSEFAQQTESAASGQFAHIAERTLKNHQPPATKRKHDKILLQRQIDATDRQIDKLVYELYGLTEEEIGIVEEAGK